MARRRSTRNPPPPPQDSVIRDFEAFQVPNNHSLPSYRQLQTAVIHNFVTVSKMQFVDDLLLMKSLGCDSQFIHVVLGSIDPRFPLAEEIELHLNLGSKGIKILTRKTIESMSVSVLHSIRLFPQFIAFFREMWMLRQLFGTSGITDGALLQEHFELEAHYITDGGRSCSLLTDGFLPDNMFPVDISDIDTGATREFEPFEKQFVITTQDCDILTCTTEARCLTTAEKFDLRSKNNVKQPKKKHKSCIEYGLMSQSTKVEISSKPTFEGFEEEEIKFRTKQFQLPVVGVRKSFQIIDDVNGRKYWSDSVVIQRFPLTMRILQHSMQTQASNACTESMFSKFSLEPENSTVDSSYDAIFGTNEYTSGQLLPNNCIEVGTGTTAVYPAERLTTAITILRQHIGWVKELLKTDYGSISDLYE